MLCDVKVYRMWLTYYRRNTGTLLTDRRRARKDSHSGYSRIFFEKTVSNSIHEAVHEANRNALAQGGFELFEPKKNLIITACWT